MNERRLSPFLIFFGILTLLVASVLVFIQSRSFATLIKANLLKYVPKDAGLSVDFSEFSVRMFPPGLSVVGPRVSVTQKNILNLPVGSSVVAERIDFNFRPLQAFTGRVRIHEISIEKGDIHLVIDTEAMSPKKTKNKFEFHWQDLVDVRADAIAVVDTRVDIDLVREKRAINGVAKTLRLEQRQGRTVSYALELDVAELSGNLLKELPLETTLDSIQARISVDSSGAQLGRFEVKSGGAIVRAQGTVRGDILKPKALALDLRVEGDGDIPDILKAIGIPLKRVPVLGRAQAKVAVKGELDRPLETFQVDGSVELTAPRFQGWAADRVSAEGSWKANTSGGNFQIKKVVVEAEERERVLPSLAAHGGRVEVGPLSFALGGGNEPFNVPLKIERAHIHWFLGAGAREIYPLTLRASGTIPVQVQLPSRKKNDWSIQAELDGLVVNDFGLDNQKQGTPRPLTQILKIPRIRLGGPVRVDAVGVHIMGVVAQLDKSRFTANGKVDFKKGFDFRAGGQAVLTEIGELAQNAISGEGLISAHIHGPAAKLFIDFDADLRNARYLNLNLGNAKGRITWDDDPNHLLFDKFVVTQGASKMVVDGVIDLGKGEKVDLGVVLAKGSTREVMTVFDHLVQSISWFPRTLDGSLSARATVRGGLGLDKLTIDVDADGSNWEYLGETARSVKANAGLDRGLFYVRDATITKRDGSIKGGISFDEKTERIEWKAQSFNLTLSDLDWIASLDVPFRGAVTLSSQGSGKRDSLVASGTLLTSGVSVGGRGLPDSRVDLSSGENSLQIDATVLGGQGKLLFKHGLKPGSETTLKADFIDFDFTPALLLLNSRSIQDPSLRGLFTAGADLRFPSHELDRASGTIHFDQYSLEKGGTKFALEAPVTLTARDGNFELPSLGLEGRGAKARVHLGSQQGRLTGAVNGQVDLGLLTFFTPVIQQSEGQLDLDFAVGGTLSSPALFGKAKVQSGLLRISSLDNPIENISGTVSLKGGVLTVSGVEGALASGRVSAQGTVELSATHMPELALRIGVSGSRLKVYPFQHLRTTGSLSVTGSEPPYSVDGELVVDSALIREKMFGSRTAAAAKTAAYAPPPKGARRGNTAFFKMGIQVLSEGGILIQNDLFDAEAKGDVKLVGTIDAPRLLGSAEIVSGKIIFTERAFQVQSGSVNFDNAASINPAFAINGATEVNGTKVQMVASGRIDKFKVELSSNPPMPESDILNLLAIGFTSSDARKLNAADRSAVEKSEAFSLVLHSLDFNRELQNKSGFQIQLDESINTQAGTSVFRPLGNADTSVSPKIVIKRQVEVFNRPVSISAGSTVGVGTTTEREVNAETKILPGLSLIGVVNSREIPDLQDSQVSFGGDLKFQWRIQ